MNHIWEGGLFFYMSCTQTFSSCVIQQTLNSHLQSCLLELEISLNLSCLAAISINQFSKWLIVFSLLFSSDLDDLEPNAFLSPFLEVIRSEDTTGPITGLALTSVNKFLSYGLVCKYFLYLLHNIDNSEINGRVCFPIFMKFTDKTLFLLLLNYWLRCQC